MAAGAAATPVAAEWHPAVSVVVPVGNAAETLSETLQSIASQTLVDFECICVPNGVTDGSLAILQDFAAADGRFRIVPADRPGAGNARNVGLQQARGKYLAFLDADDLFDLTLLADLYARIELAQGDVCVCDVRYYQQEKQRYTRTKYYLRRGLLPDQLAFSWRDIPDEIFDFTAAPAWNKLFRRGFVMEHNLRFQDTPRMNDLYFSLAALALAERICVVDKILVSYRRGVAGAVSATRAEHPLVFLEVLGALQKLLRGLGIYQEVEGSFVNYAMRLVNNELSQQGTINESVRQSLLGGALSEFGLDREESCYRDQKSYRRLRRLLEGEPDPMPAVEVPPTPPLEIDAVGIPVSVVMVGGGSKEHTLEAVRAIQDSSLDGIELIWVPLDPAEDFPAEAAPPAVVLPAVGPDQYQARNRGLAAASGEYVVFADCDVVFTRYGLEHGYRVAAANDLDYLVVRGETFSDPADEAPYVKTTRHFFSHLHDTEVMEGSRLLDELLADERFRVHLGMQLLRRSFLVERRLRFGSADEAVEALFVAEVAGQAERAMAWGEPLVSRRLHSGVEYPTSAKLLDQLPIAALARQVAGIRAILAEAGDKDLSELLHPDNQADPKSFELVSGYLAHFKTVLAVARAHPEYLDGDCLDALLTQSRRLQTDQAAEAWLQVPTTGLKAGMPELPVEDQLLTDWTIRLAATSCRNRTKRRRLEDELRAELAAGDELRGSRAYRWGQSVLTVPRKLSRTLRRAPREIKR